MVYDSMFRDLDDYSSNRNIYNAPELKDASWRIYTAFPDDN